MNMCMNKELKVRKKEVDFVKFLNIKLRKKNVATKQVMNFHYKNNLY